MRRAISLSVFTFIVYFYRFCKLKRAICLHFQFGDCYCGFLFGIITFYALFFAFIVNSNHRASSCNVSYLHFMETILSAPRYNQYICPTVNKEDFFLFYGCVLLYPLLNTLRCLFHLNQLERDSNKFTI